VTAAPTAFRPASGQRPWLAAGIGICFVLIAFAVYSATRVDRYYNHFVWQASAYLEGQVAIRYPVAPGGESEPGNDQFQDVLPIDSIDGVPRGLLPFPPLPAVVLLPFVALWGLATDDQAIYRILAAIDIGIAWWALGFLPIRFAVRLAATAFLAFGTVFWFTAQVTTTWYQAHIVALGLLLLSVGLVLANDPRAAGPSDPTETGPVRRARPFALDVPQFAAGLLFGLACTARLSIVVGAPFLALVGGGGDWRRRTWSAGLGLAIPILVLVLYNLATTGQVLHPAYEYLYRLEAYGYPELGYHPEWAVEDLRYIPQNAAIAFLSGPAINPTVLPETVVYAPTPLCVDPGATRGLFDAECPIAVPRDTGMSVLLTSPAYLLAIPALLGRPGRLVAAALVAIVAISLVNLMHFSQGWVQFGYRFSNDVAPFALVLVALGAERLARRSRLAMPLTAGLLVLSVAINAWGVVWSRLLGW
jgi:hypothetical protein